MSNVQIKDLITVTPTGVDLVPISQEGKTRSATVEEIRDKNLRTEVENARNGEANLDTRLDKFDTSLSERVRKSTVSITYYVDTTNGLDINDGLTSGTAFKTIQYAINLLPQIINHTVNINVIGGTYNETPNLSGFDGSGVIKLNGGTDLTMAVNYKVNNIIVVKCSCSITITGFQSTSTSGNGFYVFACSNVIFNYCNDVVTASSKNGFSIEYSFTNISACQVSNKSNALFVSNCSVVFSNGNSGTGNTYGLNAINASTIGKYSTQPSGTTAESTAGGGVIR